MTMRFNKQFLCLYWTFSVQMTDVFIKASFLLIRPFTSLSILHCTTGATFAVHTFSAIMELHSLLIRLALADVISQLFHISFPNSACECLNEYSHWARTTRQLFLGYANEESIRNTLNMGLTCSRCVALKKGAWAWLTASIRALAVFAICSISML